MAKDGKKGKGSPLLRANKRSAQNSRTLRNVSKRRKEHAKTHPKDTASLKAAKRWTI